MRSFPLKRGTGHLTKLLECVLSCCVFCIEREATPKWHLRSTCDEETEGECVALGRSLPKRQRQPQASAAALAARRHTCPATPAAEARQATTQVEVQTT